MVAVIVKCVACGTEKGIKAGEIPADEVPMCDKCFMPMVARKAKRRSNMKDPKDMAKDELMAEVKTHGVKGADMMDESTLREVVAVKRAGAAASPPVPPPPPPPPTKKAAAKKKPAAKKAAAKKAAPKKRAPSREVVGGIESNVPVPAAKKSGKYPLAELQPGESFLVTCPAKDYKKVKANVRGAARRVEKKTGAKFQVEIMVEEKGVRCWRVDGEDPIAARPSIGATQPSVTQTDDASQPPIDFVDATSPEGLDQGPAPVETPEVPDTGFKLPI